MDYRTLSHFASRYISMPHMLCLASCQWDTELKRCRKDCLASVVCEARTSTTPEDIAANDGWKFTTRIDDIDIFLKKSGGSPLNGTKGVGYISAPAEVISFIFSSSTRRTTWDEMYAGGRVLDIVDQFTTVVWSGFKAVWPVSGRDFVCIGRQERWEDGSLFSYNCSVMHPKMPEEKSYIRGELVYCAVLVQPSPTQQDPQRCRIVYTVVSDPKGSLPTNVVNAANVKQPCVIATIRKFLQRPGMLEAVKGDHTKFIGAVKTLLNKRGRPVMPGTLPPMISDVSNPESSFVSSETADSQAEGSPSSTSEQPTPNIETSEISEQPKSEQKSQASVSVAKEAPLESKPQLDQSLYAVSVEPLPPNQYDAKLKKCEEMAWRAVTRNEDDGWKFKLEQDGVKVYLKPDPNGGQINFSKGVGIISGSPETVRCVFAAAPIRLKWDSMYDKGEVLEQIDMNTVISYASFKAPWPVSGRDFCSIGRTTVNPDGSILVYYTEHPHPKAPAKKGLVRGEVIYSALYIKPVPGNPNKSEVVYALGTNPKGSIPTDIVNAANTKQPLCVGKIGHLIETDRAAVETAIASERTKYNALVAAAQVAQKPAESKIASESIADDAFEDPTETGFNLTTGPLAPNPYDAKLSACEQNAWRAVTQNEEDGWKFRLEEEGVKIYLKADPNGGVLNFCKGVGIIPGTPEMIRCVMAAGALRQKWDEMYDKGEVLEIIDTNTVISYASFKAPWPVSPRDFCSMGRSIVKSDGSIFVFYANHEHPKAKPIKGNVRGELIYTATLIKPVPDRPGFSEVTYAVGTDPKGSLPKSLVNEANVKQPLCVARIGEFIRTNPEGAQEAIRLAREFYDRAVATLRQRRQGQVGDETNVSSGLLRGEPIPGVTSVRWPELSVEAASGDENLGDSEIWRKKAILFANKSTRQHFGEVRSLVKTTGLFPLRDATDPSAITEVNRQLADFELGVLSLKLGALRGSYAGVLDSMNVKCLMQLGNRELLSTSAVKDAGELGNPTFVGTANSRVCFPVSSPNVELNLTLVVCSPEGTAKSVLGNLTLTLGELFEGSSRYDPCAARRGWYALSKLPLELDRAAARRAIQLRNAVVSGKKKGVATTNEALRGLDEPVGLFICLETNVVYSLQKWFACTAITTQPTTLAKDSRPAGSLQLSVPPTTSKTAAALLSQQSRLERDATDTSARLTGAGKLGDVASDEAAFARSVIDHSTLSNPLEAVNPLATGAEFFVPELFVHNVVRLTSVGAPILDLITEVRRICSWSDPSRSAVTLAFWIVLVQLPHLIPTVLSLLFLWTAVLSAANWHFREASGRSSTPYALELKRREGYASIYAQQIRALQPHLSSRAKALLLALQTSTGRLASLLDRAVGLCTWAAGNEITGFLCVIVTIVVILSRFLPTHRLSLVVIYFVAGWHTTLLSMARHLVNCLIQFNLQLSTMHRDCELLRLLALKSQIAPDTTIIGRGGLAVGSSQG